MFGSGVNEVIFVLFFKKCSVSVLYFHLETTLVQLVITYLRLVDLIGYCRLCICKTLRVIYCGAKWSCCGRMWRRVRRISAFLIKQLTTGQDDIFNDNCET